jgi:hypothetical protein
MWFLVTIKEFIPWHLWDDEQFFDRQEQYFDDRTSRNLLIKTSLAWEYPYCPIHERHLKFMLHVVPCHD